MGFTFDDSVPADDDTPGIPSPIATMERLIAKDPRNADVIFPCIGGEEVNTSPTHSHHRYVINFGEGSEESCRLNWPDLLAIVEKKVKPERQKMLGKNAIANKRAVNWWLYGGGPARELYAKAGTCARVLFHAFVSKYMVFGVLPPNLVFAGPHYVFTLQEDYWLALLQSRAHEAWALCFSASLKDDVRYTPSDCFETFPFPAALLDASADDPAHVAHRQSLEANGERYHQFRAELMVANDEGLTSTYNRFHDPAETSPGLLELRRLHGEMDQAVLHAYGWSDVPTACGFGLDYLDTEEDVQIPDALQERIDSGDLFFWDAEEACAFESQLRSCEAVKGKKKLPWRYRWPDAVRDDVLARLLALNAERYAEEVAQGLHSKGSSKASSTATARSKRRGRPAKAADSADTEQIGLTL